MKVSERNVVGLRAILEARTIAGVKAGRAAGIKILDAAAGAESPLILDFRDIELVTASAFREAVLAVVQWAMQDAKPCFLANVNEVTREEALIAAEQLGIVLLFCDLRESTLGHVRAIGPLEAKLETALRLVLNLREADAKAISDASGEATVITAWNNRLVALMKMGLLVERKFGKTKFYSPVARDMSYGK